MANDYSFGDLSRIFNKNPSPKDKNKKLVSMFSVSPAKKELFVPVKPKKIKTPKTNAEEEQKRPKPLKRKISSEELDTTETKPKRIKKQIQRDPEENARTIFIGNLPKDLKAKTLKQLFRQFGEIESVRFRSAAVADPKTTKKVAVITREFHKERKNINAYIKFKEKEFANNAQVMNGKEIEGFHIRVDLADLSKKHDHRRSVFLGNLPYDCEEEGLHNHFKDCGKIESIRIIRDPRTGIGKGFGYVLFKNEDSVQLALELNSKQFQGRALRIQRSIKKEKKFKKLQAKKEKMKGKSPNQPNKRQKEFKKKSSSPSGNSFQGLTSSLPSKSFKKSKQKKFAKKMKKR